VQRKLKTGEINPLSDLEDNLEENRKFLTFLDFSPFDSDTGKERFKEFHKKRIKTSRNKEGIVFKNKSDLLPYK
jgi:hypothetical protein